mmetsp:Transcript_9343/g.16901  ORF Transcript_9343/g.16901 Transcript_9343/m.16901 type:complete len:227 (+) Transcript_9343:977-1657(+)
MKPPHRKDMPRTNNVFDSTDPSRVAFTTSNRPFLKVWIVMIISTALPKVAFKMPAIMSFCKLAASSSVASPSIFAKGIMAAKFHQKMELSLQLQKKAAKPTGKHSKSRLIGCMRIPRTPGSSLLGGLSIVDPLTYRACPLPAIMLGVCVMNMPVLVEALPSRGDSLGSNGCACANSRDPAFFSGMMSQGANSYSLSLHPRPLRSQQVDLDPTEAAGSVQENSCYQG